MPGKLVIYSRVDKMDVYYDGNGNGKAQELIVLYYIIKLLGIIVFY